jgi:hypothetical protein
MRSIHGGTRARLIVQEPATGAAAATAASVVREAKVCHEVERRPDSSEQHELQFVFAPFSWPILWPAPERCVATPAESAAAAGNPRCHPDRSDVTPIGKGPLWPVTPQVMAAEARP